MPNLEIPLDLPEVRILKTETDQRQIIITVESIREWAICRKCGQEIRDFHSYNRQLRLRHMPILGRPVIIEIRPKRFRCPTCDGNPTTTQTLDWYDERSPNTKAYDQWLLLQTIGSTVSDVARKEETTQDIVLGAIERLIQPTVDWSEIKKIKKIEALGIDEIALKKGHRDFVALITARLPGGELKLLAALPDRKKETIVAFLRQMPKRFRTKVQDVCIDMWDGYANAAREILPQANIVADRFHVAKAYRDCADKLRVEAQRELKKSLSKEHYDGLKGTMWLFRRDPEDLDDEERGRLELLFECAPDLKQAYDLRQELTAIFDADHTRSSGRIAIEGWVRSVRQSSLACFDSFLKTLENWLDEITNYFVSRRTSGFVEGFNNKVKVLKRRCYGITNLEHLYQRLYLDLEGDRLFGR